jgi:branched-chain amino acid transport system substrate-binding protein
LQLIQDKAFRRRNILRSGEPRLLKFSGSWATDFAHFSSQIMQSAFFRRSGFSLAVSSALLMGVSGCKTPTDSTSTTTTTTSGTAQNAAAKNCQTVSRRCADFIDWLHTSLTEAQRALVNRRKTALSWRFPKSTPRAGRSARSSNSRRKTTIRAPIKREAPVLKLINDKNVLVVLGDIASSNSLAAAPACQSAGVPMVSPSSTNPKVTQVGDYIFRTCFIDPFQGSTMSTFARDTLKAKTAAIFTDTKSDYSKGLTQFFREDWEKNGGKIVRAESYAAGDTNFRSQLTNIKSSNPDIVYVPGYYTEVGNMARQAKSLGLNKPMLGGDGWNSPQLFAIGGPGPRRFVCHRPLFARIARSESEEFRGQLP